MHLCNNVTCNICILQLHFLIAVFGIRVSVQGLFRSYSSINHQRRPTARTKALRCAN